MWATALFDDGQPAVRWGVVIAAAAVAAAFDLRTRRIPNLLTGPLLVGGLVYAAFVAGFPGWLDAVVACLLLATPYVVLFVCAGGGAGDAKLMGALGAWLGMLDGTATLLAVCLSGIVFALLFALWRRSLGSVKQRLSLVTRSLLHLPFRLISPRAIAAAIPARDEGLAMPYGPAILAGCVLACGASLAWSRAWIA
jgi:Flp pilus assembly protein protease CpaA